MIRAEHQHILVVRTDRIGDVILTLPMITALRAQFPSAGISLLLRSYTAEIAQGFQGLNSIVLVDQSGAPKPFLQMVKELASERFDTVILAHPTFRLASMMALAGIATRVGTGYRWYSFLFNRRVFEHRKTSQRHEADYNLSLLGALGDVLVPIVHPRIVIPEDSKRSVQQLCSIKNITKPYVVLHPGSGGSARDWKAENFGLLASRLHQDSVQVVVTGMQSEESLVHRVCESSGGTAIPVVGSLSIRELGALIQNAELYISNSTGPLHLAAAVGVPVVAFYPPIRECSPVRWGPLTERKRVFEADNRLCTRCRGGECQGDDCMDQITVDDVYAAAKSMISNQSYPKG